MHSDRYPESPDGKRGSMPGSDRGRNPDRTPNRIRDRTPKPGLWCRVADELGVVAAVGTLAGRRERTGGKGGTSRTESGAEFRGMLRRLLIRGARRHVAVCARCQAERSEWARIAGLLEHVEHPGAPASLYEGLMAKIAVERAEQRAAGVAGGADPGLFAEAEPTWLAPLLALVLGWGLVVSTMEPLFGRLDRTLALTHGAAGEVWGRLLQVIGPALSAMPPALEPLAVGLGWGALGWGATVAVLAVSKRLSEVF